MALTVLAVGCVSYKPRPMDEIPFRERAVTKTQGALSVTVAVPGAEETRDLFGVPLYPARIQPVWVAVDNHSDEPFVLIKRSMDPEYYSPAEVAYINRFTVTGTLTQYGIWSLPLLPILLPKAAIEAWSAGAANEAMAQDLHDRAFHPSLILPGEGGSGFVFTREDPGTKNVRVVLFGPEETEKLDFAIPVPGIRADHLDADLKGLYAEHEIHDYDEEQLSAVLHTLPCCTTRANGSGEGDPLNLVVVGDFDDVLGAFTHAGWDESERVYLGSAWRTLKAFFSGAHYRVSPVSNLYVFGRKQEVAFQKVRDTIHERHHFRLWLTPYRIGGDPVWIGAASRDIGVYFTTRTWNLATHAIDPDVDDARDYVVEDLFANRRLAALGFVGGVGAATPDAPRRTLMHAAWHSDGQRAVVVIGEDVERPHILDWRPALQPGSIARAKKPTATVRIASRTIAVGAGVTWNDGILVFKGKRHAFAVRGLGLLDLDLTTAIARGEVWDLAAVEDFAGTYVAVEGGVTLVGDGSALVARNEKGVLLHLRSETRGMQLALGPRGLEVELKRSTGAQ